MRFPSRWLFPLILALALLAAVPFSRPAHRGDVAEYALTTIALAAHGTPDIRLADLERGKQAFPGLAYPFSLLEPGLRDPGKPLWASFARADGGKVYAIHFFGYSALAVAPYQVLGLAGLPRERAFQVLNIAAIVVLGLGLRRLLGCGRRAVAGVALFMLFGGTLYWTWSSPECLSAALLLAGLSFYVGGAPVWGSVLAGIAAQQNPTMVAFFGFAPLLYAVARDQPGLGLDRASARRQGLGIAAGLALFALPPLFNLWQFGVPSLIARDFTDPSLVGPGRLHSLLFDLNQGMVIAIPGLLAALALWGWQRNPQGVRREATVLALCAGFTLALVLPALSMSNWNSDAAGVMRYAFWAGMPLVFALLLRMRHPGRWPLPLLAGMALLQGAAMSSAGSYSYTEFGPVADIAMRRAPGLYRPDVEIFAERSAHNEEPLDLARVYSYQSRGKVVATLFNEANPQHHALLCGPGAVLAQDNLVTEAPRGWRYIHGDVACE